MKTFKQFLEERHTNEIRNLIEEHCAPFLAEVNRSGFLYRGVRGLEKAEEKFIMSPHGDEVEYTIKGVRSYRRPLDTKSYIHGITDEWFKDKFGFGARTEAVFAFGEHTSLSDIKVYGTPCIIFPIGKIKYVWSRQVDDLFSDLRLDGLTKVSHESAKKRITQWLDNANYKSDSLNEAVQSSHEIMLKCDAYFAFPAEYKSILKEAIGFS